MINAKIYYSFNYFMTQGINKADNITRQNHERGFEKLFNKDQVLINVVLDVSEKYKSHWENANNNSIVIDKLLSDAANELYRNASQQASNL